MYIFAAIGGVIGLIAGIIIAAIGKKADGVVYTKLDKAGIVTNILLIIGYVFVSFFFVAISLFSYPDYDGFLGILGWIVCGIIASVPLACGIGLGLSVKFRKQGKSKLSFWIQFAGLADGALSLTMFMCFYGNLLGSIN